MSENILLTIKPKMNSQNIGNKARNIAHLMEIRGLNIPKTWVIPWHIFSPNGEAYLDQTELIVNSLDRFLDPKKAYAVRSSSNVEDDAFHSFAGLFLTKLNIVGFENLIDSIFEISNYGHTQLAENYFNKFHLEKNNIHMAVIIQEMVQPLWSGVLFSQNPMTGAHEIIIEVVAGEGTALVQEGFTPERWVFRSGGWVAEPNNSTVPDHLLNIVIRSAKKIINKVNNPVDLEWVYDGKNVYWVQMREITTLDSYEVYSNRLSKDMMPGMIHPLIWSINVPLINSVWLGLLEEIVGPLKLKPQDLAKSFFYRSYFNMGAFGEVFSKIGLPSESLEMMMGFLPKRKGSAGFRPSLKMIQHLPRMVKFFFDKWLFVSRIKKSLPLISEQLSAFSEYPDPTESENVLVEDIENLYQAMGGIVYLNIVTPLLVSMHIRLLEKHLKAAGVEIMDFDLFEDMPELDNYNPNIGLSELKDLYDALPNDERNTPSLNQAPQNDFEEAFTQFIREFGSYSDNSNNFMVAPWREIPEHVMDMVRTYSGNGQRKNPKVGMKSLNTCFYRRRLIKLFYKRVRRYTIYTEKIGKAYIYGYGLFRPYFLRIADWMVEREIIGKKEDIFYLTWDEIRKILLNSPNDNFSEIVEQRKTEMQQYRDIDLPEIIYGDDPPPIFSTPVDHLYGTPTSHGYYSGPVRVIHGHEEFKNVQNGDVIVIPYSDVGWTPLFDKAGAVIADSGGMLSHSSIIAREYQIPAVVSVKGCMKLDDDLHVSVNGYTGEINVLDTTSL